MKYHARPTFTIDITLFQITHGLCDEKDWTAFFFSNRVENSAGFRKFSFERRWSIDRYENGANDQTITTMDRAGWKNHGALDRWRGWLVAERAQCKTCQTSCDMEGAPMAIYRPDTSYPRSDLSPCYELTRRGHDPRCSFQAFLYPRQ